jgi:hypothetical protein
MLKGLAVAIVVAAVVVPTAAAKSHHPDLKLALLPLPKAKLGSAAAGLKLSPGSGPRSDGSSGQTTGYVLTYGSLFLANPGLDEVETGVEVYKTPRAAKRAVKQDRKSYFGSSGLFENLTQLNLTAVEAPLSVPAIGDSHWAALLSLSVLNYGSVYYIVEEIRDGKYVLELAVAAGSQDLATSYAASKTRVLDRRLHLGLNGRLHGRPVALPKFRKPGPPASGLDPATAVLQTSDLPGSQIEDDGYGNLLGGLSNYYVDFEPAGSFDDASQIVSVMASTNSAGFLSGFLGAEIVAFGFSVPGAQVTPVDLSAVDDEAQAAIVSASVSGQTTYEAVVTLHSGAVSDIVAAESSATIDASDVQTLAQAAANRLDAALP